jgi:uncharacterized membrane protein
MRHLSYLSRDICPAWFYIDPTMFFFLPEDDLRVSDAERDAAVEFLNRHYAEGRLTEAEHSARIDAAYAARYDSQLEALTDDLPYLPPARLARRGASGLHLGPAAAVGAVAVGGVAAASVVPPEAWGMLLGLVLPLVMMLLFTVAPLAIPVLVFVWIARALTGPSRRQLPRGYGGWELHERNMGRRPTRWP